ncbi:MAG: hypothetical protein QM765_45320 [Myxococcales bacterium]
MPARRPLGYSCSMPKLTKKPVASEKPFAQKVHLKPDTEIAVLNGPPEAASLIGELPARCEVTTKLPPKPQFVLLFVLDSQELGKHLPRVAKKLGEETVLWIAYPKGGSGLATDLNRDVLFKLCKKDGLQAVSNVALDATWSALRFKRA